MADEVTGRLVDSLSPQAWADVLESVMTAPDQWQAYGKAAEEHAAQFSWTAMAQRMIEIYASAPRVA